MRRTTASSSPTKSPRKKQRGTSLLETVAVVTIAGTVSAVAVPKVADLPREARVSVVKAMEGAVHSASALIHMKCIVQTPCDIDSGEFTVLAAGDPVKLTRGYPSGGEADGIENALQYTGFTAIRSEGRTVFAKDGAANANTCAVVYDEPPADGKAPSIQVLTAGC